MNDMQERQRVRSAIDRTLENMTGDPFLQMRVTARMNQEKEGNQMKRNHKFLIVTALVIMLSLTVALASEILGGSGLLDWDGNLIPDPEQNFVAQTTPVPPSVDNTGARERQELFQTFQNANRSGEGVLVVYYDRQDEMQMTGETSLTRGADNWEELTAMVGGALPLPVSVPEGYVFFYANVIYACRPEGAYRLVGTVESPDGFRAETYTLDAEDQVVIGYELQYLREGAADYLTAPYVSVDVRVMSNDVVYDDGAMYLLDVVESWAASVPGMEKAVAAQGAVHSYVSMYGPLAETVTYQNRWQDEPVICGTVDINITGHPAAEELLSMFGGK